MFHSKEELLHKEFNNELNSTRHSNRLSTKFHEFQKQFQALKGQSILFVTFVTVPNHLQVPFVPFTFSLVTLMKLVQLRMMVKYVQSSVNCQTMQVTCVAFYLTQEPMLQCFL